MSAITFNVIISGNSVSGNLSTSRDKLVIDLGNSDKIGRVTFALQNKDSAYSTTLLSGNAMFQVDAMLGNTVVQTVFRGTLEEANALVDVQQGSETQFTGYDYGQELLGLLSPDARPVSSFASGLVSYLDPSQGDQGMGSTTGADLVLYVSGTVTGAGGGVGTTSGQPAANLSMFMSQFFGKSGDTTGSASGALFSFKPYFSGQSISGANAAYRTWYAQDGAPDTNANYSIPFDRLKVRHEYAWDVLRKLTRHSYIVDRSGYKVQFETYIGVSGDIHLRTSGASDFVASGVSLVYYQAGNSGADNNNIKKAKLPWNTAAVKNYVVGWFPTWTVYPLDQDTYTDITAYSGTYWSGGVSAGWASAAMSGASPSTNIGLISIQTTFLSGSGTPLGTLNFFLFSGSFVNLTKWNVKTANGAGNEVDIQFDAFSSTSLSGGQTAAPTATINIYDSGANTINNLANPISLSLSGWTHYSLPIFTVSGTFNSGYWAMTGTFDFTTIKRLEFNPVKYNLTVTKQNGIFAVDNLFFSFTYPFSPVSTFNSGSIQNYGRRYEVFEFPQQSTLSGAQGIITTELQSRMFSRQLAEFVIKDSPNQRISAQLNVVPGQAFVLDAPSLAAGSGQFYYYFVATEVRHEWSHQMGFETHIKAYPWFSGQTVLSGQNLINYNLPMPFPVPRPAQSMPNTTFWPVPAAGL